MKTLANSYEGIFEMINESRQLYSPVKRSIKILISKIINNGGDFDDLILSIRRSEAYHNQEKQMLIEIINSFQAPEPKSRKGFDPLKAFFDLFK